MEFTRSLNQILIMVLLALAIPCAAQDDAQAGETAHLQGEARELADWLIAGLRAGFEDLDFETFEALWAEDAQRVWARSQRAGERDIVFDAESLIPTYRIIFGGQDAGVRARYFRVVVVIDGDRAMAQWQVEISTEISDYREVISEQTHLRRDADGNWRITHVRAWMERTFMDGGWVALTQNEWSRRDRQAQRAAEADDPYEYVFALMDAYRMPEAHEILVGITEQPDAEAIDWSLRGYTATLAGIPDDVYPCFERAREMDPDVWLPHFAIPREPDAAAE